MDFTLLEMPAQACRGVWMVPGCLLREFLSTFRCNRQEHRPLFAGAMQNDSLAAVFKSFGWILDVGDGLLEQRSQPLQSDDLEFTMRIVPYAAQEDRISVRGGVSMFLDVTSVSSQPACFVVKYVLTIVNQKDSNLSVSLDEEQLLDPVACESLPCWGFKQFISQDLLLDDQAGYQVGGKVLIEALISVQKLRPAEAKDDGGVRTSVVRPTQRYPVAVIVASSEDLRKHVGPGLVNFDRALKLSLSATTPAVELEMKIRRACEDDAVILPCQVVEGPRGRAFPARVDIQKPLKPIQISRNSIQDLVRPLGAREWRLLALKREKVAGMDEGGILVFFKFFDNQARSMELVCDSVLEPATTVAELVPKVNTLVGLMPTEPLFVWLDNGSGSPRRLQDSETCQVIGLVSGAVLYFQKAPADGSDSAGLTEYLSEFTDRVALSLHPLHPHGRLLSVNVRGTSSGATLLSEISRSLTLPAGTHVSVFPLDSAKSGPRACALSGEELTKTVASLCLSFSEHGQQHSNQKLLYYEVRDSQRSDRTLEIAWFGPKVVKERVFSLPVTHTATVGEVLGRLRQMAPLSGTGDLRLVGTWKHRVVWVAGGANEGSGFACGKESDALSAINCQVALRAEEVADDAFGSLPHHRLVQVTHIRMQVPLEHDAAQTSVQDAQYLGDPFLLLVAPDETVLDVWDRISCKIGPRVCSHLACIAPSSSSPIFLDKDDTPLLQHLAESPGSFLGVVHASNDDELSTSTQSVPQANPSRTLHHRAPPPDNPPTPPSADGLQPGLWARLSAAVDSEDVNAAPEHQSGDGLPLVVNPSNPSHSLSFPLPIPHAEPPADLPLSHVDRAADLAFELETLRSELMEERLMVEGLQLELRRATEERIDDRITRGRMEESLDDAQSELSSALEVNAALQRQLNAHWEGEGRVTEASPIDVIKELSERQVHTASMSTLNMLEDATKELLSKIVEVRKSKRGVPDSFLCPITQEIMQDPVVVVQTGHTYERAAIERWFQANCTDPKTNVQLNSTALIPNHGLRATIEEYVANR